jgi:polysaccharide biosynthesis transport protein
MNDYAAANDEFLGAEDQDARGGFALNFGEIKAILYRQRYILIAIISLALIIGFVATSLMTPIYSATSKAQIEADRNQVTDDTKSSGAALDGQRFLTGKVEALKSRKMAARVADKLRLSANNNFLTAMNVEPISQVGSGQSLQKARRTQVIDVLVTNLSVDLPFNTNVASISFKSPSRTIAVQVANEYADSLITGNIEQRFETTSYARDFLEKEIFKVKQQLEISERDALEYARTARIIDASDGVATKDGESTPKSITTANLVSSNGDLSAARTERIKAAQRWVQAQRTPIMQLPEVLQNASIQALQQEKVTKQAEYQELSTRYKSGHPALQAVQRDVSSIENEVRRLAANIRGAIQNEYNVAAKQEASLESIVNGYKTDTLSEQNKRVELNLLTRDVDINRAQYQSLLERFKQLNTDSSIVTNNISIIDRAESAAKVSPRMIINLMLAGFLGAALASLIAFLREMLNDSITAPAEITSKLGLSLLGVTPLTKITGPLLDELRDRKSILSEAYASIRSSLQFSTPQGAPKSLLVTSAQPSEGKTTSAISLAESFGQVGKRVLLVDADLRNPSLHRYTGLANNKGFGGLLTRNAGLDDVIIKATKDRAFDLLPSGPVPPNPAEILLTDSIAAFLEAVSGKYDHIIIDGPPIMGLADSPQIGRATAGTLLIVQSGGAMRSQTQSAVRRLRQASARIVGSVLSQFDSGSMGYGEYYGYSYKYGKTTDKKSA